MKKVLVCFLAAIMLMLIIAPNEVFQICAQTRTLYINEVMAANSKTIRDGDIEDKNEGANGGEYSDWIEIYNSSEQPVDLTAYTLSDSGATWVFPQCTIQPKGYLLVWASDKNKVSKDGQLHTNFKLSASGEEIILRSPNGDIVDSIKYESLLDDQSYGRKSDGSQQFEVFTKATPLEDNAKGAVLVREPILSKSGGFYTEAFDLIITSQDSEAKIYYTTDGSDPIPEASGTFQYTGSIKIKSRAGDANVLSMVRNISTDSWNSWKEPKGEVFKGTTLKTVAIKDDGSKSKVITHTYFVDSEMDTRYTLPVISIVTDFDNLFDSKIGIYTENSLKTGEEWERPAHVEFFESNGELGFSQNIGLRIHGGYSRKFPQKSFRIYADGQYGDLGEFKYEIFPGLTKNGNGKKMKSFERLILRNTGNDWNSAYMRDELMQSLISHVNILDTQAQRPAILFLNGEYWGVYYIRERYDKEYLEDHYNLDDDKVAIIEPKQISPAQHMSFDIQQGTSEDADAYTNEVINYLKENSISQSSTYEYIKTKIDIDNYIIYNVAEIFFGNTDWPANNVVIWKYRTDDGKYNPDAPYGLDGRWRWMLKDTDFGFGLYNKSVNHDTLKYAVGDRVEGTSNPEWSTFLLKTLLQNDEFRNKFINCFADQLNTAFIPERVLEVINEFEAILTPEMQEHTERWPYFKWSQNVKAIKNYAMNRPSNIVQFIKNKFASNGVTGTANITLNTDTTRGYLKINTIDIKASTPGIKNPDSWTGLYFTGVPVTISAVAKEGYVFDHWEGVVGSSETVTFNHTDNINITAVFKKDGIPELTPTPTQTPTSTSTPTPTPTPTQTSTPTPTPTPTPTSTPTSLPTPTASPQGVILGDVNSDGFFNSLDFGLLRMYLLGIKGENEIIMSAGDVDANGDIDSIDFAYFRLRLIGVINKFPAE